MKYKTRNSFRVPITADPNTARVAMVQVAPEDACAWRVTLSSLLPFGLESGFTAPQWGATGPKAIVRWGHEGGSFWAAVDWTPLGNTFRVAGYDVTVDLQTFSGMVIPAAPAASQLPAAFATIVPGGARDNDRPPTFSKRVSTGGAATVVQDMPPFTRRVRFWNRTAAPATSIKVRFLDDAAGASVRYDGGIDFLADRYEVGAAGLRGAQDDAIDVPSYAAFIEITTGGAVTLQMEYELDLG